ncbi:hypothetical protein [Nocardia sp. NPDC004711]
MRNKLHRDLRRPAAGAGAAVALAVVAGSMLAGPANASIDNVSVAGLASGKSCSVADGCTIQARLTGNDQLTPVDFLVNGTVIGTVTPTLTWAGAVANMPWHPDADATYTIGVRQGFSSVTTFYVVGAGGGGCPSISSLFPGSSSSGSAGSGSAGSGSGGSGSAGTGSAGSGSASGSATPLPIC